METLTGQPFRPGGATGNSMDRKRIRRGPLPEEQRESGAQWNTPRIVTDTLQEFGRPEAVRGRNLAKVNQLDHGNTSRCLVARRPMNADGRRPPPVLMTWPAS